MGIADNAPQQARIGGGNAVVPVQVELRQRRDVDAKNSVDRNVRHQFRVHPVNPLDNQNMLRGDRHRIAPLAAAGEKIIARQPHLLAVHQRQQGGIEQLQIERLQVFVVVVAFFIPRRFIPINNKIIQADGKRAHSVGFQLHRQPLAERGFAAGRWAGNEHQPHLAANGAQKRGNLGDALLLQCL